MRKIFILSAALLCGTLFQTLAQGVDFRNLTFQQALEKAKEEQKLLFVDGYTSWCGPCKNMLENVFTLPEAGEFMNDRFVCVKYDMEKGEGIELRKRFEVRSFPTFFIIRPDGLVQHKLVGGSPWERFRMRLERGIKEKTSLYYLENRHQGGKLAAKEYAAYVDALKDASAGKQVEIFCRQVFNQWSDKKKSQAESWFLFDQEMQPDDERFIYLVSNKSDFDRNVGKEKVDKQIVQVYSDALNSLHGKKGTGWVEICGVIGKQLEKIDFLEKNKVQSLLKYVIGLASRDVESVLLSLENEKEYLPAYVDWDMLGTLDFIAELGDDEQLERYLRLGRMVSTKVTNRPLQELMEKKLERLQGNREERAAYVKVTGKVTKEIIDDVSLYEVVDGKERLIATTRVGKDGCYGFSFVPAYSGFYTVGGKEHLDRMRLYLKPGDCAELNILEDTLVLTSRNTSENLLLSAWESMMIPVRKRVDDLKYVVFDYRDFFPYFMDFLPQAEKFKSEISFHDTDFEALLRQTVDFDLSYYAFRILNALKATKETYMRDGRLTHIPSRPTPKDYPSYYETIVEKEKLSDSFILKQPYGYDYLQRYVAFACGGKIAPLRERLEWLPCDLLKAEIILGSLESCRTYEDYTKILDIYGNYLTRANHQERLNAVSAKLYKGSVGKAWADFTYPDRNGKMVSLSDFRGKVVVVDVWATWCGPCRAEIPHLVKLEEEMKDKDVVFIGVSVDARKDYTKWQEVLKQEGLGGVQLFANGENKYGKKKIMSDYKIEGIPRFMVFDKKGNVVTIHSPRPSNPELKKLLERELKK